MRVECISTYKCLEKLWLRVSTTYALAAALTTLPARNHHFIPSAHSSQSAVFTLALSSACHLSVPPTLPKQLNLSHRCASLRASSPSPMLTFWMQSSRSPGPAGGTVRASVDSHRRPAELAEASGRKSPQTSLWTRKGMADIRIQTQGCSFQNILQA